MNERDAVALGALLHDIGKFWQRTGRERHLYDEFTKGEVGRHGLHALWSGLFFEKHVPRAFRSAGLFAQFHHRPETLRSADEPHKEELTRIVWEADHLAAQFDRDKRPADEPKGSPAWERLEAVTERIAVSEEEKRRREGERARHYYPLAPLSLSDGVFPAIQSGQALTEEYARLWDAFAAEHAALPDGNFLPYFDSLLHLLHKYCWCIPSATYVDYPSISLYDHSRVAAALAVCLHAVSKKGNTISSGASPEEEFLLIEGDISGIQGFIYNPAFNGQELQDGMAKRLRGRSFYLNLLLKTLADYLTEQLELYSVNTLWATGGHFLLIAPNTEDTRDRLTQARAAIEQWLWRAWRGALGIVIADLPVSRKELANFGEVRDRLGVQTGALKLQQMAAPLSPDAVATDNSWQTPWVLKMQSGICRDTGRDLSEDELAISAAAQADETDPPPRSPQSLLFDCIGRVLIKARALQLRRAGSWGMADQSVARQPRSVEDARRLRVAGEHVLIEFPELARVWLLTSRTEPESAADLCLRIRHNDGQIRFLAEGGNPAPQTARGFELLAARVRTRKNEYGREVIAEFHELADAADGAKFLGVLRMDVDDLGYIFAQGLPPRERSISKIANLSRMFDWFFSGYLNTLVADKNLYTTYAGGDDLFIVGAWNEVLEAAARIQAEFKRFCGDHPDLHISGGIALCKGTYPIGRAAEEAGEKLDRIAKTRPLPWLAGGDTEKDALAFLERKISWDKWQEARALGDELIAAYEDGKVSRKFIYTLLELYRQHIDPYRDPAKDVPREWAGEDIIWVPRFKYSLVRNVRDSQLRARLLNEVERNRHYLSILAGYVSLRTRAGRDNDTQPATADASPSR